MFEDQEQLEFAISQYLDGTLEPPQRAALEQRLAADAQARELLEQYRKLDRTLRAAVPKVNWDKLQTHLSDAVARQQEQERRHYSLAWVRRVSTWAAAACLLIAGAGVLRDSLRQETPAPAPVIVAEVSGPTQEAAQGPAVCDVQLGMAPADQAAAAADDAIVAPTSRIEIASDQAPAQETRELPF